MFHENFVNIVDCYILFDDLWSREFKLHAWWLGRDGKLGSAETIEPNTCTQPLQHRGLRVVEHHRWQLQTPESVLQERPKLWSFFLSSLRSLKPPFCTFYWSNKSGKPAQIQGKIRFHLFMGGVAKNISTINLPHCPSCLDYSWYRLSFISLAIIVILYLFLWLFDHYLALLLNCKQPHEGELLLILFIVIFPAHSTMPGSIEIYWTNEQY